MRENSNERNNDLARNRPTILGDDNGAGCEDSLHVACLIIFYCYRMAGHGAGAYKSVCVAALIEILRSFLSFEVFSKWVRSKGQTVPRECVARIRVSMDDSLSPCGLRGFKKKLRTEEKQPCKCKRDSFVSVACPLLVHFLRK